MIAISVANSTEGRGRKTGQRAKKKESVFAPQKEKKKEKGKKTRGEATIHSRPKGGPSESAG